MESLQWKLIAEKSIGTSHERVGLPCQDFCDVEALNISNNQWDNIVVGAIADGAGSAKYAEIGSQIAVERTLEFCKKRIKKPFLRKVLSQNFSDYLSKNSIKLVTYILKELAEESNQKSCSIKDFSCTLIAFIASPDFIISLQIGDGFLVTKSSDSDDFNLLFQPEKGEYANETTFITSVNVDKHIKTDITMIKNLSFICASTDGLERVALNLHNGTAYNPFFQPLYDLMASSEDKVFKTSQILSFLESDKLNSRTDDDKSMILCFLSTSQDT
jgi:hypothetical protein